MQAPNACVGPNNAKNNPTILTESTDHGRLKAQIKLGVSVHLGKKFPIFQICYFFSSDDRDNFLLMPRQISLVILIF